MGAEISLGKRGRQNLTKAKRRFYMERRFFFMEITPMITRIEEIYFPAQNGEPEQHRVVRDYGEVLLTQTLDNFIASSAAYMAVNDIDNETSIYWFSIATNRGIIFQ